MEKRDLVKQVRAFANSELRMNILLCLKNGEKDITDLQKELGGRNTTILHAIKDMSDSDLITKNGCNYSGHHSHNTHFHSGYPHNRVWLSGS
jgi:predicted transcriptional regulator